jgi:drug/metabolite transporter (DMT)-like permease
VIDSLLIVVPGLIWGASFLFIAEGLEAVSPSGVAFLRILVGFLTLSLVPAVRRPILKTDRSRTAVLGLIWLAFPLSMFPYAEQHVSSALAGMLNGAVPLFVAAVASGLARRLPPRAVLVGLSVGFLGTILIAMPGLTASGPAGGQAIGVLLILAALVSYGFAYSLSGPLQQRNGALPVIWRALGVAVVLTAPLGVPAVLTGHWSLWPVASLVALGAGGTGVAYVLTAVAAGRLGATVASVNNFFIPVVALLLGVGLRHEQVSWISIAGAAVCLAGAWLIRRARLLDQPPAASPTAATSQA